MDQNHGRSRSHNLINTLVFTSLLIAACASSSFAEDLDMDCRKVQLPVECRSLQSQLEGREAFFDNEINRLTEDLQSAPHHQKPRIRSQIARLRRERANDPELRRLKREVETCRVQFDRVPRRTLAPDILLSSFMGNVSGQTTHPDVKNTTPSRVLINLQFSRNRCVVTVTGFVPISFLQDTPVGNIRVTIRKVGGGTGSFFPLTGQVIMPLELFIDYDRFVDDDRAVTTFTTRNSVSPRGAFNVTGVKLTSTDNAPVDQCNRFVAGRKIVCTITLVGTTVFQGGFLGGHEGMFRVTGNVGFTPPEPSPCLGNCEESFRQCIDNGLLTQPRCNSQRTLCRNNCRR